MLITELKPKDEILSLANGKTVIVSCVGCKELHFPELEVIEIQKPCVLTAIIELNTPRYMSVLQIEDAYKKEIVIWDENDLSVSPDDVGLKASPTQVFRSFTPPPKGAGEMLSGTVPEMAASLVAKLTELHVL